MAYSKRIPPIKIKLNVDEYNKLLEILENMIDSDNENYSNKSSINSRGCANTDTPSWSLLP